MVSIVGKRAHGNTMVNDSLFAEMELNNDINAPSSATQTCGRCDSGDVRRAGVKNET